MDYNTFFNSPCVRDRVIMGFDGLNSQLSQNLASSSMSSSSSTPVLINTVSYRPIEQMSYGFKYNFFNLKNNISSFSSFLPMETSDKVWTTLIGLTVPVLCYAGYKVWKWIKSVEDDNKVEPYEYKYIKELDDMLQTKLDDIQNPEMADIDTIRIGKFIFPLDVFKSFKRNFRKRLIRKTDEEPIVKRVPIPAEEFDWKNAYVEEFVPNNNSKSVINSINISETNEDISEIVNGKRVLMRYEPDTESFWWYSDSSSIQYKYLETIARKYVYDFNRLDVFIDIRDELKKGVEASKKHKKDQEENSENKDDDKTKSMNEKKIYAKFKRYNKKAARTDPTLGNKMMIIKAKANRYSYKGKICEYEKLMDEKNKANGGNEENNDLENVSWSEWKKINFDYWK